MCSNESLYKGVAACREGNRIGDIANALQTYVEQRVIPLSARCAATG